MNTKWKHFSACILVVLCALDNARAQDEKRQSDAEVTAAEVLAGHSFHGEAFNEGPRQKAYLMGGTGNVHFPVTTRSLMVRKLINQGVGQLHGFWYFEAERSFRQAAAIDPDCAMAYWGMALANRNNRKRAKGFIENALKRKDHVTERERMYIDALNAYTQAGRKQRSSDYAKALEKILYKYPNDTEARAFLGLQLWQNRSKDAPIASYLAVDALLQQVLAVEPMHPAHHFRIHLWDYQRPETALDSAAKCGPASPSIAHMWHMPGHIYSRLKRYNDAAWQQEASARVDHAHMMRDRVMPDQIGNFAHNNEWLIRNLIHVGRVRDAVDLAKNMIELPRHPTYNNLGERGSAYYGRLRLFQVLGTYELRDELIELCDTVYLEPTELESEQIKRRRYLGTAYIRKGDVVNGEAQLAFLREHLETIKSELEQAVRDAETKASKGRAAVSDSLKDGQKAATQKPVALDQKSSDNKADLEKATKEIRQSFRRRTRDIQRAIDALEGHLAVANGDYTEGLTLLKKASSVDPMFSCRVQWLAGKKKEAVRAARAHVRGHKNEVQPLANLSGILWDAGEKNQAIATFRELRELSGPIDLDTPVFRRLQPIVAELGLSNDWRVTKPPPVDIGERPSLDSLGPFRWQPSPAPQWKAQDAQGKSYTLKQFRGRPLVLIFYLGYGCLHCAEQLKAFGPETAQFQKAGLSLLAISTDDQAGLRRSIKNYDKGQFPFPLVANAKMDIFKAYRAYDDFEDQPLHGTFLIDRDGMVLWQDISYEPFMDPEFVLKEANRLLAQQKVTVRI